MSSLRKRLEKILSDIAQNRVVLLITLFCVLSFVLVYRLFVLQIVNGADYAQNYSLQIKKTKSIEGTRGNIYDRNGKLLAYNALAYSVTIEDSGDYDDKNKELNEIINTVINIVEKNGDTVINDFGIILDSNDNYEFVATSDTQKLRFIADVYGQASTKKLTKEQKNSTPDDIMNYLCTDSVYGYDIDTSKMKKEDVLKLVNIRYAISLNSYQKYITTTIASEVSDETVADIMENSKTLKGVAIEETSIRKYTDAKCFANVIGYTGQISTDEYNALSDKDKEKIDKTDIIGKAGIEKTMDSYLQGTKGEETIYVNNVGKVIESHQTKEPEAGNDVYLTIDADLQVAAYNILEQEIAGIVLNNMISTLSIDRTVLTEGNEAEIPIGDAYNAFISNDILDMSHFSADDASSTEKEVYKAFTKKKKKILEKLQGYLQDPECEAYKDMTNNWQGYMYYIVSDMLTTNNQVIMKSAVDTSDKTYQAWHTKESINIYTFLNYCISKNWIDTSKLTEYLPKEGKYSESNETYKALCSYIIDNLKNSTTFDKLVYKYMIRDGQITGKQICLMIYDQGVLKMDKTQYENLKSGKMGAYDFIRGKLEDLRITPGQLGLEPSTGSMVVTDPNSGEVLACVSYPGYDNNRLANSMDSDYYNQLVTGDARPLYNNATQEKTAPGSTYKPLSAIAALTEGAITTNTSIACDGIYKKVDPNPKCWVYPEGHGALTVVEAIEHSCNCFFYDVGYRLSQKKSDKNSDKTVYSGTTGLSMLEKYAKKFGLGSTSGVEIPEADPQISDSMPVPSAIGQGTNNYTTTQLAKYISTVANEGTVYQLTLLDKVEDPNGKTIKEYKPKVENTMDEVADSSWEAVHEGMKLVVNEEQSSIFSEVTSQGLSLAGKTGTAQQSTSHANHGLFVGFSPIDKPEVAFAIRIANGYSSHRAAEVGRDVMAYYYNIKSEKDLITGKAASIGSSSGGD